MDIGILKSFHPRDLDAIITVFDSIKFQIVLNTAKINTIEDIRYRNGCLDTCTGFIEQIKKIKTTNLQKKTDPITGKPIK